MLKARTFKMVLVKENHGVGVEPGDKTDKIVVYNGKMKKIKF